MVLKKQTVWLLSMLTIMVVLSAYYLVQGPVEQVPLATEVNQEQEQEQEQDITVDTKQLSGIDGQPSVSLQSSDYFIGYKMERDAWNHQKLDEYMSVMSNSDASSEAITQAKESYESLLAQQDAEMNLENLIKALGYEEAVIVNKDNRINVMVQAEKLEPNNAIEIITLVTEHMAVPGKNVVVSYKK